MTTVLTATGMEHLGFSISFNFSSRYLSFSPGLRFSQILNDFVVRVCISLFIPIVPIEKYYKNEKSTSSASKNKHLGAYDVI